MPKRLVLLSAVLAVVLAAGAALWWWRHDRGEIQDALAVAPASTLRFSFTDWAEVRREARAPGRLASSGALASFLNRAYESDLTALSAIDEATAAMQDNYGFSGLTADWEAFAQGREGAVVALRMPGDVDMGTLERRLGRLRYSPPPGGVGHGGVWVGGQDLPLQIDPTLTPVMQNVAVLADQHLVLLGDDASFLAKAVGAAAGSGPVLADEPGVAEVASQVGSPVTALLYASDFACEDLSMANADEADQALAEQLVSRAGGISPLSGMVIARHPDSSVVIAMQFESPDQAKANLEPRVKLASGDAVGQGGTFGERFRITKASASGSTVRFDVRTRRGEQLLSDLGEGPVLFATC